MSLSAIWGLCVYVINRYNNNYSVFQVKCELLITQAEIKKNLDVFFLFSCVGPKHFLEPYITKHSSRYTSFFFSTGLQDSQSSTRIWQSRNVRPIVQSQPRNVCVMFCYDEEFRAQQSNTQTGHSRRIR